MALDSRVCKDLPDQWEILGLPDLLEQLGIRVQLDHSDNPEIEVSLGILEHPDLRDLLVKSVRQEVQDKLVFQDPLVQLDQPDL